MQSFALMDRAASLKAFMARGKFVNLENTLILICRMPTINNTILKIKNILYLESEKGLKMV